MHSVTETFVSSFSPHSYISPLYTQIYIFFFIPTQSISFEDAEKLALNTLKQVMEEKINSGNVEVSAEAV